MHYMKLIASHLKFFFHLILVSALFLSACQSTKEGFTKTELEQLRLEIQSAVKKSHKKVFYELHGGAPKLTKDIEQKKVKKEALKKIVVGRVEWIGITSPKIEFIARIDTGAQSCSMHAEKISEKKIEGERYVEFTTLDDEGKAYTLLKKVVKTSMVKGTSGVAEKRYVVKIPLKFGRKNPVVNVNLNDRRNIKHRFLVGRNLLLKDYVVDVTQSRLLGDKE